VFAENYQSGPQSGTVIPPPRAGLLPVHGTDLEKLEPDVREHLLSIQNSLIAVTKATATTDEKLSETYGLMGQVYHAYSLTPQAEECYVNAHRLAPRDFRWAYLLANILHQGGRAAEAAGYYQIARALRPDYQPAPVNLGNLYLRQNRLEEARASFADALKINANCPACRYGLGQVALSARDYKQAVAYLEQALKEAPEANRIHYALAMAYRGAGDIEKARTHLEHRGPVGVRVSDPLIDGLQQLVRGERLHLIRGRRAFDARRFSEAADEFRKGVLANPDSVPARVNLGSALAQMGEIKEAIEQFQQALRIDPKNAAAHYNLGLLLAKQSQHEQAIPHLRSALGFNPEDADARFLLAQELVKCGRQEEALAEFSRIVESNPGNEEALLEQVDLLLGKKQYHQAIERLEKGHALFPEKGRTAIMLAYLLACSPQYNLRDGTRALALARLVYQSTGSVNHGAIVAMALAELGRCNEAAQWQRQMIAAAERDGKDDFAEKLKADLRRYENAQPCRPQGEVVVRDPSIQQERKRP
jgi:tetratricopeptide (TPR) repeat protein